MVQFAKLYLNSEELARTLIYIYIWVQFWRSDVRTPVFSGFGRSGLFFYRTPNGPGFLLPNIERSRVFIKKNFDGAFNVRFTVLSTGWNSRTETNEQNLD